MLTKTKSDFKAIWRSYRRCAQKVMDKNASIMTAVDLCDRPTAQCVNDQVTSVMAGGSDCCKAKHVCGSTNSTANSYQHSSSKEAYKTVSRIPKKNCKQYVVKALTVSTSLTGAGQVDDSLQQWALTSPVFCTGLTISYLLRGCFHPLLEFSGGIFTPCSRT